MLTAIQTRRATFLARDEWIQTPFSQLGASSVQDLISHVAILPSLLGQVDELLDKGSPIDGFCFLIDMLIDLVERLEDWEVSLRRTADGPLYWPTCLFTGDVFLWFRDITIANVYIHFWAFQILCLEEAARLVTLFPGLIPDKQIYLEDCKVCHLDAIPQRILELSRRICMGTEYFLQEDMMLYGPLSILFPLQTAYVSFTRYNERKLPYLGNVIRRVQERGVRAAASYITNGCFPGGLPSPCDSY